MSKARITSHASPSCIICHVSSVTYHLLRITSLTHHLLTHQLSRITSSRIISHASALTHRLSRITPHPSRTFLPRSRHFIGQIEGFKEVDGLLKGALGGLWFALGMAEFALCTVYVAC